MNSQNVFDDSEEPIIKDGQFISGKLKSPTKMHDKARLVRYETNEETWSTPESGGL